MPRIWGFINPKLAIRPEARFKVGSEVFGCCGGEPKTVLTVLRNSCFKADAETGQR